MPISCHKSVLSNFTALCSDVVHHKPMLFNRSITLRAYSMKFCLVTYIFFKLFLKVIVLVIFLQSTKKINLLL